MSTEKNNPSGRTVKPDGRAIQRLRLAKGWRVEDLARYAKCSVRTVENIERGANVYMYTLTRVAQALAVEYKVLLVGAPPLSPPSTNQRRFPVQLTIAIAFEEFDQSDQLTDFIRRLKKLIDGEDDDMDVTAVDRGSVIITVEMTEEDIGKLYLAFGQLKLLDLRISTVRLPDDQDFVLLRGDTIPEELRRPGLTIQVMLPPEKQAPKRPSGSSEPTRPPLDVGQGNEDEGDTGALIE
jgi:transcriptional regulator with XRE-family HTH domain